ncbi:MAG: glycosyltransferase [Dehalococcoidia bacterium]|nr:glycosyltransferase [Dehalococcoidia bacterium]
MKLAMVYDVIHPYVIGGVQKRNWEIARRLVKRGHDVTLFGMKHWEGSAIKYSEGVRLWGVCPPQDLFKDGRRSIREAMYFACRLFPSLTRERFDVVEVANFPYFPCFAAAFCCLIRRSRLVITWHEVWGDYWYEYLGKKGVLGKAVEAMAARLPHSAIAISPHTMAGLMKLGLRNAQVVGCGVDMAAIASVPRGPEPSDIIYVGRLAQEKNVAQLLRAIGILMKSGSRTCCLIIGEGPERQALERQAGELGIGAGVRFLGRVENDADLYSYMKASRVLVQSSTREGFSHVVLEANACGIPVITVNHPHNAAKDLVTDGLNGFVCDQSDSDMAQKIARALSTGGWEERCRQFAASCDWDAIADVAEKLYLEAWGARP